MSTRPALGARVSDHAAEPPGAGDVFRAGADRASKAADAQATGTSLLPTGPGADAWAAFLEAHAFVMRRLAAELEAEEGLSLADFDALIQLAIAPDRRRRMSDLADALLLSRSGVSRMVDRLVAAGLVERRVCPSDLRGAEASLTPAGEARLRRAAEAHFQGVTRHFVDLLAPEDLAAVTRALRTVAEHNRGAAEPDREQVTSTYSPPLTTVSARSGRQ